MNSECPGVTEQQNIISKNFIHLDPMGILDVTFGVAVLICHGRLERGHENLMETGHGPNVA